MRPQKTLYQLLGISNTATLADIAAANRKAESALDLGEHGLSREDVEVRRKALKQAYEVLADDYARMAYDAKLTALQRPEQSTPTARMMPIIDTITALDSARPPKIVRPFLTALRVAGLFILIWAMFNVFRAMSHRMLGDDPYSDPARKRMERVVAREYYQTNGVNPGSRQEADVQELEARNANAKKAEDERKKAEAARKYQVFVNESRREGERVSEELHEAEASARQEEEYRRQKDEAEREAQQQAEEARADEQRRKWAQQLGRY